MAGGKRSRGGQIKKNKEPESTPPPAVKDSVKRPKVLIVANKLPISVERNDQGSWSLNEPVGGLGNALFDVELEGYDTIWIGWPGVSVEDEAGKDALTKALEEKNCVPIFLSKEIVREYYHGFCYKMLWPLFHYLGLPQVGVTTKSFQTQFEAYEKANKLFANEINLYYEEGDLVWCHDYHLMFLPQKLKELDSNMKVGWFLHTPFPSSEIPQMLPSISELLRAVLAADLVGFQTYDCARHFMGACTHILELKGTPDWVADQGRWTRVAAFPIGINSQRFISALQIPEAQDSIKKLREDLSGKKVIFGVDHFDMTKGILQKYLAFEKFLEENEDWREKVVLVQIAIPPKIHVDKYEKLASQVYEMVGRINGRFATYNATPIHHLDRSLDFIDLCEYYAASDVALVTSLRDGMNLVSYEFVACQDSNKGVLILSEFAGASQSLGSGAILVNPWNIAEVAAAIGRALNMPAEERETLHRQNFEHITKHTSQKWAKSFISELEKTKVQEKVEVAPPPQLAVDDAVRRYVESKHGLLVLGFTDTLTEARGGEKLKLHPGLIEPLKILCKDPNTTIVVLSGCCKNLLGEIFGDYAVWLASENGMFVRPPGGEQDRTSRQLMASDTNIEGAIQYFDDRTPGAQFVKRETSLMWDYKHASNAEFGRLQARDLMQHLLTGTVANSYVTVFRGSHSIELRAPGITKGMALVHTLEKMYKSMKQEPGEPVEPVDYVLCLGHFTEEDENIYDIFDPERERDWKGSKLPAFINLLRLKKENYFPCAVGRTRTSAKHSLNSSDDVATLLKAMADAKAASKSPR